MEFHGIHMYFCLLCMDPRGYPVHADNYLLRHFRSPNLLINMVPSNAAGKVKASHRRLQVSNVSHVPYT